MKIQDFLNIYQHYLPIIERSWKNLIFIIQQKIPVRVPIHYDVPRPYEVIKKVPYTVKVPVDKP